MAADLKPAAIAFRIESLLGELEADARSKAVASELVRSLMEFYGSAVARVVELVNDAASSGKTITPSDLAADPAVATVLLLHDLHPDPSAFAKPAPQAAPMVKITRADGSEIELPERPRTRASL